MSKFRIIPKFEIKNHIDEGYMPTYIIEADPSSINGHSLLNISANYGEEKYEVSIYPEAIPGIIQALIVMYPHLEKDCRMTTEEKDILVRMLDSLDTEYAD